jgi:ABC-type cobalamin/Fe3+-siderophores transport system ATPase subunit
VYRGKDGNSKKIAVRELSLSMARGQCFGVLGPNGAGKTTLINMVSMNAIDTIIYFRATFAKVSNTGHSLILLYVMKAMSILHVRNYELDRIVQQVELYVEHVQHREI